MIGFDCIRTYTHGIDVLLKSACFLQYLFTVRTYVFLVARIGWQNYVSHLSYVHVRQECMMTSLFFTAKEEECLKQAESLARTKTRTRELNTGFIADRYHTTVLLYL